MVRGRNERTGSPEADHPDRFLLPKKKYTLTLYQDDPKMETRTKVAVSRKTIKGGDSIRLDLLASGGAAMEIEPLP